MRKVHTRGFGTFASPSQFFPEHYTNPLNLALFCRECHNEYDSSINFRKLQTKLYERVKSFDERGALGILVYD